MMKLGHCDGIIGQHLKVESTSRVAASVLSEAFKTIVLTSLKVPSNAAVVCCLRFGDGTQRGGTQKDSNLDLEKEPE
jgi:hypothetical protein